MKPSTAAFWLLIVFIFMAAIVTVISMFKPEAAESSTVKSFFEIIKYGITLVGGGFLGVQIGEKYVGGIKHD